MGGEVTQPTSDGQSGAFFLALDRSTTSDGAHMGGKKKREQALELELDEHELERVFIYLRS